MSFEEFLREKIKKSELFGSYRFDASEWSELAEEWHSQEREKWVLSVEEIKQLLFELYPMSYGDDGECQLRGKEFPYVDGNKIATTLHKMLKERAK